jgi:hypothetical protein
MRQFKSTKIYFCLVVMLLVAKPFAGFTMFSRNHLPASQNILVKIFSKRTLEYSEDSSFNMIAIHKNLANPVNQSFLRFSFLLGILFPLVFGLCASVTNRFLRGIALNISLPGDTHLRNSTLII